MNALQAARQSLALAASAFTPSPLDPVSVALAVGREHAARAGQVTLSVAEPTTGPGHLLGCWVDGKLRFQSRQHDNVHAYAQDAMSGPKHRTVWVAPVGSFVDTDGPVKRQRKAGKRG